MNAKEIISLIESHLKSKVKYIEISTDYHLNFDIEDVYSNSKITITSELYIDKFDETIHINTWLPQDVEWENTKIDDVINNNSFEGITADYQNRFIRFSFCKKINEFSDYVSFIDDGRKLISDAIRDFRSKMKLN